MVNWKPSQKGYMVYSKVEEKWVGTTNALDDGKWEVNGSPLAQEFFMELNPKQISEDEILPYLEAYFVSRTVKLLCKPGSVRNYSQSRMAEKCG